MSIPKTSGGSIPGGPFDDDELSDYRQVFPQEVSKFPYTKPRTALIAKNRAAFGGQLFFDMLCTEHVDKVENSKSRSPSGFREAGDRTDLSRDIVSETYPPRTTSSLRHLFDNIITSNVDRLKQHAFVYYLLRDYGEPLAKRYAERAIMPEHSCLMMDGVWLLDNCEFEVMRLASTCPPRTQVVPSY